MNQPVGEAGVVDYELSCDCKFQIPAPPKGLQPAETSFRDLIPRVPSALLSCEFLGRVTCNNIGKALELIWSCDNTQGLGTSWNSLQIPWFIPLAQKPYLPGPAAPHGPTLYSLLVRLRSVGPAYDESGRPERHKQFSFV